MRLHYQSFVVLLLLFNSIYVAQPKTNFELIDSLLIESALEISENIEMDKEHFFNFIGSNEYSILNQRLIEHISDKGIILKNSKDSTIIIDFTMIEARTDYPEIFKDQIFGGYLINRVSKIDYSFRIIKGEERGTVFENSRAISDTISYSDLPKLENVAYSFTSSEVPDEPLFSSALEPVIAIGAAAVAVYLFFNIRSK